MSNLERDMKINLDIHGLYNEQKMRDYISKANPYELSILLKRVTTGIPPIQAIVKEKSKGKGYYVDTNLKGKIIQAIRTKIEKLESAKSKLSRLKSSEYKKMKLGLSEMATVNAVEYAKTAVAFDNKGNIDKAIEFYNKSISISEKHNISGPHLETYRQRISFLERVKSRSGSRSGSRSRSRSRSRSGSRSGSKKTKNKKGNDRAVGDVGGGRRRYKKTIKKKYSR